MTIKDKLDIFIVTYNREENLDTTLKQLMAENSPVRDFDIHILDNNSTDNTYNIVKKYQTINQNIKYEKNVYNIGLGFNIAKAFYLAKKEYVWVLADNDYFDFDNWNEVEYAIKKSNDVIIISNFNCPETDIAQFIIQCTFLPGRIFKTSNITDTVIGSMLFNAAYMFTDIALIAKLINNKKKFYLCSKAICLIGNNIDKKTKVHYYHRGFTDDEIHPMLKNISWDAGFANSIHQIKDKKIRNYILKNRLHTAPVNSISVYNNQKNLYNVLCIFNALSTVDKFIYLLKILYRYSFYYLFKIEVLYSRQHNFPYASDHYTKKIIHLFGFKIKLKWHKVDIEKYIKKRKKYNYKNFINCID